MRMTESQLRKIVRQEILSSTKKRMRESVYDYEGVESYTNDDDDDLEEDPSGIDEDPDAMEAAADNDNEAMYKALERVADELGIDLGMDQIGELVTRAIDEV